MAEIPFPAINDRPYSIMHQHGVFRGVSLGRRAGIQIVGTDCNLSWMRAVEQGIAPGKLAPSLVDAYDETGAVEYGNIRIDGIKNLR